MAKKRIIAYFMHEAEQAEAARLMQNSHMTESYVLGDIEESEIAALQSKGVICHEVATPRKPETPGMVFESRAVNSGFGAANGRNPFAVETRTARPGAQLVYLVQLRGPLLEE